MRLENVELMARLTISSVLIMAGCAFTSCSPAMTDGKVAEIATTTIEEKNYLEVASRIWCTKVFTSYVMNYNSVKYTDGSRDVSCNVMDANATYSASYYYAPAADGATDGSCLLMYDREWNATAGYFEFTLSEGAIKATYFDSSSSDNGLVESFSSSNCQSL